MEADAWIDSRASVLRAAQLMRRTGLPFVIVTEAGDEGAVPLGVISTQDIVMRVMALGLDARVVRVGDVLTTKVAPALDALLRRL